MKAILNQEQLEEIQTILQLFPIKFSWEVGEIVKIINSSLNADTEAEAK